MYKLTYTDGKITTRKIKMYETGIKYISTNGINQVYKFDIGRIFYSNGKYYTYSLDANEIEFKAAIKAAITKRALIYYHKWRNLMQEADDIL